MSTPAVTVNPTPMAKYSAVLVVLSFWETLWAKQFLSLPLVLGSMFESVRPHDAGTLSGGFRQGAVLRRIEQVLGLE